MNKYTTDKINNFFYIYFIITELGITGVLIHLSLLNTYSPLFTLLALPFYISRNLNENDWIAFLFLQVFYVLFLIKLTTLLNKLMQKFISSSFIMKTILNFLSTQKTQNYLYTYFMVTIIGMTFVLIQLAHHNIFSLSFAISLLAAPFYISRYLNNYSWIAFLLLQVFYVLFLIKLTVLLNNPIKKYFEPGSILKTAFNFSSSKFEPCSIEDDNNENNPDLLGTGVANYIKNNLITLGYEINCLYHECEGVSIEINNKEFPIYIGCGNYNGYKHDNDFFIFITPNTTHIRKWFNIINTEQQINKLANDIYLILANDSNIHNLKYSIDNYRLK